MRITLDITNGTINDARVDDPTDSTTVELVGLDYDIAPEDEGDTGQDDEGTPCHVSAVTVALGESTNAERMRR